MNAISAYASTPQPLQPVSAIVGRSPGEDDGGSGSPFKASEGHSHEELASTCPTCGHKLNLSV